MNKTLLSLALGAAFPWLAVPAFAQGAAASAAGTPSDTAPERTKSRHRHRRPAHLAADPDPDHHRGHHARGDRAHASTPPTARTRSSTCPACWCASATSATTTTPCCRPAPRAPATARARPCTPTASCCRTTSATAPPSRRAGAWSRPEEIERVDVLYGPFSAAYGGNSVGAVVDYVTRMPTKLEAHVKPAIRRSPTTCTAPDDHLQQLAGQRVAGQQERRLVLVDRREPHRQRRPAAHLRHRHVWPAARPARAGVPVYGAVRGPQHHQHALVHPGHRHAVPHVQDHVKLKLAYDFTPTVRATYTLGWWQNVGQRRNRPATCATRRASRCTAAR
jgi:iron complex outermembrane receptor protein